MNIYFQTFSSYAITAFRESILPSLNAQQKKICIIASLALGFLVTCYLVSRYRKHKDHQDFEEKQKEFNRKFEEANANFDQEFEEDIFEEDIKDFDKKFEEDIKHFDTKLEEDHKQFDEQSETTQELFKQRETMLKRRADIKQRIR